MDNAYRAQGLAHLDHEVKAKTWPWEGKGAFRGGIYTDEQLRELERATIEYFRQYPPWRIGHIGYGQGYPRELYDLPPEELDGRAGGRARLRPRPRAARRVLVRAPLRRDARRILPGPASYTNRFHSLDLAFQRMFADVLGNARQHKLDRRGLAKPARSLDRRPSDHLLLWPQISLHSAV